jgi:hypothetical protein
MIDYVTNTKYSCPRNINQYVYVQTIIRVSITKTSNTPLSQLRSSYVMVVSLCWKLRVAIIILINL